MEQDIKDYLSIISELKQVYQHVSLDHSDLKQIVIAKYYQWVLKELECVLTRDPITSSDIVHFFKKHWELVKFSLVSPTCMPHSDIVKLLCRIASTVSTSSQPPISVMFPQIMWQGVTDEIVDLDGKQDLNLILQQHILSDDGKTLIPITYLTKSEIISHDYQEGRVKLYNPYYQTEDYQYQQISSSEFYRLCHHSHQTNDLNQSIEKYAKLLKNKTDLFTHLVALCRSLRMNDAHVGVGRHEVAGEGLFLSLLLFNDFYSQLCVEDKQKIPQSLQNAIDLLLQVSSEPHIQTLINFSEYHFVQLMDQVSNSSLYKHATIHNYTEIYFSGSEIRLLEKAIPDAYLKSLLKPINMVQHIQSCAGLRREQIENHMLGHEALLMTIGLQTKEIDKQKYNAFYQIKFQQERLINDIQQKLYSGCDHWSITCSLIHVFNLRPHFEIYRPEQLQIFRTMQPKEIDLILFEHREIRNQLLRIFRDNWVLISFCLDVPEIQMDSILNHIASDIRLHSVQLHEILFSIPQAKYKIIMKHFMHLFFYNEFVRYRPVALDVLIKSMSELSIEHFLTFLLKPGILGAINTEDYIEVIFQKISNEIDILMKSDFYKIFSEPQLCMRLLPLMSPDMLSELTARYLDIGEANICKESFSMLVSQVLQLEHPKYVFSLSKLLPPDQLVIRMRHFDKDLIAPYFNALLQISDPEYLFQILRIIKSLKPSELSKYRFYAQIEKMCKYYPMEKLNKLKSREFQILYYKVETMQPIRTLFTRISLSVKCPELFKHLLDLYYLENNFEHINKAQTHLICMLIRNLMCNLQHFDAEERAIIFSHEVTFNLIKRFSKFDVPIFIEHLNTEELKRLVKKENNFYIRDISPVLVSYLQSVDDNQFIEVLYFKTRQSAKLIEVLIPELFISIVVERLRQNNRLIYQYWWILENTIIGEHLSSIIKPQDISQLLDFLYSFRESNVGVVETLIKYLSALQTPLYDELLISLLIKPYTHDESWAQYFSLNLYKYSSRLNDLKKRLETTSNPNVFKDFIELYSQIPYLCTNSTIAILLSDANSSIYDDFTIKNFQNLLFICTQYPSLVDNLPKLTPVQLGVLSKQPLKIYLNKKNNLPDEGQNKILMQVAEYLFLKMKDVVMREDKIIYLHETFFMTKLGMWMQLYCPEYIKSMLEICSFDELIDNLKMIDNPYYYSYFLPYLWMFYPQRLIEGLGLLGVQLSILHHINQDPAGFFQTLLNLYPTHQFEIIDIFTKHLSKEDGISFFEQYYDKDNEVFFYYLLRDIEAPKAFFKLLKALLKYTGSYLLVDTGFKQLIVTRFKEFIAKHPEQYKYFFHFNHTQSAFDFVAWLNILPVPLRHHLIEQKVLPLEHLFFQTYLPHNPKNHCYLFYLTNHFPEVSMKIFQILTNPKALYQYAHRNLIALFLVNHDVFEFLKCFPSMSPILIDYILLKNSDELTLVLQQKVLKNPEVLNFLIQDSPLMLAKCIGDYPQITLKTLKQVTNGFLLISQIKSFNDEHRNLLNILINQFSTYREKIDYLAELNREMNLKPVNHDFVLSLYLLFIKSQFEECKALFSQKYPLRTIVLYEMILTYLSQPHIHDALLEIASTIQRLLQDSNQSIGVVKFKKTFTFFGSDEHYKLEVQQKLIETHNLLDLYQKVHPL